MLFLQIVLISNCFNRRNNQCLILYIFLNFKLLTYLHCKMKIITFNWLFFVSYWEFLAKSFRFWKLIFSQNWVKYHKILNLKTFFCLAPFVCFGISNFQSQVAHQISPNLVKCSQFWDFVYCQISKNLNTDSTFIPREMHSPVVPPCFELAI